MALSQNKKDSCSSWMYLTFASLVTFFVFGFLDAYGVLLVFLVQHFKEKNSKSAWVGSTAMFGCFFFYPLALRMRYKFGIRATVLFAGALLLPVFILSPMVPSMDLLFLTFSIPFAISGSIIGCATYTTIEGYFEKYVGVAFGIRSGANALGIIMYSFLLPILLTEIGWNRTFWILTGICFITICYGLVYYDSQSFDDYSLGSVSVDTDSTVAPVKEINDDLRIYLRLLKHKEFVVFFVANTVFAFVVFMPPVFMVQFATNLGYHISKSKWLMIVRGIVAVATRFTMGSLGDIATRRRKVRYISLTVMILFSISTVLCSFTRSLSLLMCYMAFVSVVDSIYWVMTPLLVKEITRGVHSENAYALFNCMGSFATLGGPPLLGLIYDTTGDFRPVLYTASAVSAIAACLVGLRLFLVTDSFQSPEIIEELISEDSSDSGLRSSIVFMTEPEPEGQVQYVTVI